MRKEELLNKKVVFIVTPPGLEKSNLGMVEMKAPKDVDSFWSNILEEPKESDITLAIPGMTNPMWQNLIGTKNIPIWLREFNDGSYVEFILV